MTLPDREAARDWVGRTVVDRDGAEIGVCAALLADEATGRPEWMYADRDEATVVVPLVDATGSGDRVQVAVTRDQAESAPRFGPSRELSQDQEATLYRHYGIDFSTATSDSLLPAEAEPTHAGSTEAGSTEAGSTGSEPTGAEPGPTGPEPTAREPMAPEPARAAPDAAAGRPVASGGADRGRGAAAAVAVLAALAAAVVAGVRLRRGSSLGSVRPFRRAAPPPRSAAQRALAGTAAARARAAELAAAAGPTLDASGRLALQGASAGAEFLGRAASTAVRYTDVAATRVAPLLATTGRAARVGTDSVLRATDAAALAVAAAVPRVAEGAVRAGRAGLGAVLALGAAAEALPEAVAETGERLEKSWRRVMGRLSLGLGLGVGYVLGARAGRARYEQIRQATAGFMGRPEVQQAVEQVRAAAPAPLQSTIDKLAGGGSGRQGTSGGTADIGAVDPVAPPPAPASGTGGTPGGRAPVPDPLVPPAKSSDDSTGRP
ncbi:hypothetical protein SAMN05660209_03476 [Geodermatophilus africanus]|uniref:PRC-barrel domain-containing protein n=1 Tax=Geodermatophilus africanus TaxID=1137993 RepID=A0A1H3LYV7_9ACTN|nr:hypothetical protein [Geodermatophilus africanus]SDY69513.1 hypothetical protein SAMN05660209_03476 [Geodermatophilus africanus]